MPLHIVIAGGGIAGLAAAVALRRAGHHVDVYERSAMNNEVGAAINVPPNAFRFLKAWGLDPVAERFVQAQQTAFIDPLTMETTGTLSHEKFRDTIYGGVELMLAHRVDLHDILKKMATDPAAPGRPATLYRQCQVTAYNPEKPSITLADGTEVTGDLVIGADGIHSLAAEVVLGRKVEPAPPAHYNCCYRFLIPAATLEEDPATRWFNHGDTGEKATMRIISGEDRRMVSYPCRDREIHNFVGIYYDKNLVSASREDYQARVDKSVVLEAYSQFSPDLLAVINKATDIRRWPLLYRPPIPTWRRGRLILAGDAAHPMLPHQGQGGAQGLEDGFALGAVLHGAVTPQDIEERLGLYEKIRRDRAAAIQILSNVGQDQTHLVSEQLKPYMREEDIPRNAPEILKMAMGYNAIEAVMKVMREFDPAYEYPEGFLSAPAKPAETLEPTPPRLEGKKSVVFTEVQADVRADTGKGDVLDEKVGGKGKGERGVLGAWGRVLQVFGKLFK